MSIQKKTSYRDQIAVRPTHGINNSTEQNLDSFEEIGVRILNALIKFGKTELTKAQLQLLQKSQPEQVCAVFSRSQFQSLQGKVYEELSIDESASNSLFRQSKEVQMMDEKQADAHPSTWIKLGSNGDRVNMAIHRPTPHIPFKNPTEQVEHCGSDLTKT